jgi:hypothetical protein
VEQSQLWPIAGVATARSISAHPADGDHIDDDKGKQPVLERVIDSCSISAPRSITPRKSGQQCRERQKQQVR